MLNANDYFNSTKEYLEQILTTQRENIKEAAVMIGDCMAKDGIVQLFGAYHNRAFAMELGYRAGGLMPYHQINLNDLALRGVLKAHKRPQ